MKNVKELIKSTIPIIANPILKKTNKFKDIHKGESCNIILNGVSLKWYELDAFSDKISISVALTPFHKDFNKLNVKYAILSEPWWFYRYWKTYTTPSKIIKNNVQKAYREIISSNQHIEFFLNLSNYPVIRGKNLNFLFRNIYDNSLPKNFISNRIDSFHGQIRTSILLAIYLGFESCNLIGGDYTHIPSRSHHFYEKGKGVLIEHSDYNADFFEIAKEFINIKTITLDGTSENLEYIKYEDYTNRQPFYRENTDLVSEKHLNILDTWPGYNIY